ncbi:MAG: F0F1 ATP synthase subunit B [Thermomicrobiales bacterium]
MDKLGIQLPQLITQLLAFGILIFLLWRYAYRPILGALDARSERIRASMEQADRIERQLAETESRNEQILTEARREAQQIIANAREIGEKQIAQARDAAREEGQKQLDLSLAQLRAEEQRAKNELRQEYADLVIRAAGRVVRQELDTRKHMTLIDQTLSEAGGRFGGANGGTVSVATGASTAAAPVAVAEPSASLRQAQSAGVAALEPVGGLCPATHPIKGNHSRGGEFIYHVPGGASYDRTDPEVCFATEADAQAAGFRASRS